MTLIKWQPQARPAFDFDRIFSEFFGAQAQDCDPESCGWSPRADIVEGDKDYEILVELPGVAKGDIELKAEDGILILRGERKFFDEEANKDRKVRRMERLHGRFERRFRLPKEADAEQIRAGFKDGVLSIRIAKSERVAGRQIEVG